MNGEICTCPYCDIVMEEEEDSPLCKACELIIIRCWNCGASLRDDQSTCPTCGKKMHGPKEA